MRDLTESVIHSNQTSLPEQINIQMKMHKVILININQC